MRTLLTAALAATAALLVSAPDTRAQGWVEPLPGMRPGPVVTKLRTSVQVTVRDRVAQVEVEEWFRNDGGAGLGEGDYLYPLPGEAVFSRFSLFQGDQELTGETLDAGKARGIYEAIVRRRKDPALIELVGHGLVRARIFPIQPGETRRIILRYTQVLPRAGDALHFRYAAGGEHRGGGHPGAGPSRPGPAAPVTLRLSVADGAAYRDAFSPTHALDSRRDGERLEVTPRGSLGGDLSVFLPFADAPVGLTLATHRPAGEAGYFMLTLSPEQVATARVPRDLTVVVDVSGSMSGEKMTQARGALRQLLGTLTDRDRLRLVRFSDAVHLWREEWAPATAANLREARAWVDALDANGGTDIARALDVALAAASPAERLPMVVFLTDGLPSVGEQDPARIAAAVEAARGRTRVFAFGVGYDVNTLLLDGLSAAGRGSTQYVAPEEDVERAVGLLAARVSMPVLTELTLEDAPVRLTEVYPARLPDLFAGQEMVVFGRYEGTGGGELAVAGRRSGRGERYATLVAFPGSAEANAFIPRLWASRKLGELTRTIRLEGATPALVEEVRRTALRYGLLSEYTSYLVLEPGVVVDAGGALPAAPVRLQAGAANAVAAAPPAAATGRVAVLRAEVARRSREATSLADVAEAQKAVEEEAAGMAGEGAGAVRTVAGRSYRLVGTTWRDILHTDHHRLVHIEPFSAAYFALLRRLPELAPHWQAFDAVLVAGARASVEASPGGVRTLSEADIERLVREFRTP